MNSLSHEGIREAWQPYYPQPLSDSDVTEIKSSISQLLSFLSHWTSQNQFKPLPQVQND